MTNLRGTLRPPYILIVDDDWSIISRYQNLLSARGIAFLKATSVSDLYQVFNEHQDEITGIILDGCIDAELECSLKFIRYARKLGFSGPIIAASSMSGYRQKMLDAGCSHQAPKAEAAQLVAKLLGS